MLVVDGCSEEVKKIHALVRDRKIVEHHIDVILMSLKLETNKPNELSVQDSSWTITCRERVDFSDEKKRFILAWMKRFLLVSLMQNFSQGKEKVSMS